MFSWNKFILIIIKHIETVLASGVFIFLYTHLLKQFGIALPSIMTIFLGPKGGVALLKRGVLLYRVLLMLSFGHLGVC